MERPRNSIYMRDDDTGYLTGAHIFPASRPDKGSDVFRSDANDRIIDIYVWVIILSAVLSWLVAFDVVNMRNRFVYLVGDTLNRLTEPVYRPVRRLLPDMGGLDLSPLIVILALWFLRDLMWELFQSAN